MIALITEPIVALTKKHKFLQGHFVLIHAHPRGYSSQVCSQQSWLDFRITLEIGFLNERCILLLKEACQFPLKQRREVLYSSPLKVTSIETQLTFSNKLKCYVQKKLVQQWLIMTMASYHPFFLIFFIVLYPKWGWHNIHCSSNIHPKRPYHIHMI